jgi:bifunctional non-homologous end joining protein LigD
MPLEEYKRKRDFQKTPEPPPASAKARGNKLAYFIQKHDATRLHYDFRLELDGVLLSWAVTKGPSLNPGDKRLAVRTEDHPLSYGSFEGTIPKGQYGGGTVMLWDKGDWEPKGDPGDGLRKGHLSFVLHGERLKGGWALIRMRNAGKRENWLLIKERDEYARTSGSEPDLLDDSLVSVESGRSMKAIAGEEGSPRARKTKPNTSNRASDKGSANDKGSDTLSLNGIAITHPGRVLSKASQITKGELAQYYAIVAPLLLARAARHPLSLLRCPSGIDRQCFYQRNRGQGLGPDVFPFEFKSKGKTFEYLYVEDEKGLLELVQMGAVEIHPWGARIDAIDTPDRMIFDLDPAPDVPFDAVKLAAQDLRQRLKKRGLDPVLKCTGGKGLHVTVWMTRREKWAEVKGLAGAIANEMVTADPEVYVATMSKAKRAGKIFIDYFRNDYTATAIADYSVRAQPETPVALPIGWDELKRLKSASQFSIGEVLKRLSAAKRTSSLAAM